MLEDAGYTPSTSTERETYFLLMRHQYQVYAEAIRLNYSKEQTRAYWKTVSDFFTQGWKKLLPLPSESHTITCPDLAKIRRME